MPTSRNYAFGRDARANRLILALVATGFAALLAAAVAALLVQQQVRHDSEMVEHTLDTEASINAFARSAERAETARRGAILTEDETFRKIMAAAIAESGDRLGRLRHLTSDNPQQQGRIARIEQLLGRYGTFAAATSGATLAERDAVIAGFTGDPGVLAIRQIRALSDEMLTEEQRLLAARQDAQDSNLALFYAVLLGSGLLIVVVSAVTLILIRRNLAEVNASRRELNLLNDQLEMLVDERTSELQRANAEIQRFAYIVSHDLRSPLVNVMGFTAELDAARQAIAGHFAKCAEAGEQLPDPVRLAVDEDLPESIGFIRTSTQKMDRLINAILRLSREGRRTLAPAPIDLGQLVAGVIDTLQHRIQETGTEVTVGPLPTIVTDRLALEQILSNLVENAIKYLAPGRPGRIAITAREVRDRAWIEVADNGRGIDPRDHERIFDLFRRSGTQDQPGEGIGLAHVRALAYRLGGLIEVSSQPGEGSTFTLILPLTWKAGEPDE